MTRFGFVAMLRRAFLPITTFAAVLAVHFLGFGLSSPATRWVSLEGDRSTSWLRAYLESQSYWLGASYGLSLAFGAVALRRYREERFCGVPSLAFGGVTLTGFLAIAGCYLLGCCGSPMLAVYLTLFGAAFLPLAKPIIFSITAVWLFVAWWWMNRQRSFGNRSACPSRTTPDRS